MSEIQFSAGVSTDDRCKSTIRLVVAGAALDRAMHWKPKDGSWQNAIQSVSAQVQRSGHPTTERFQLTLIGLNSLNPQTDG
jgi:hypothetical protein